MHIYINNEKFSEETKIKTWLKYIWMRLHNLPSILRYTGSFYKKNDINAIYCYHSNLIKRECYSNTKILPLDFSFVDFFKKNTPLLHYEKNSLLFLSQAYYWDIPLKKFQEIMKDLVDDFRSRGIEKFYIKPHHSDTSEWITWMQENLKFEQTTLSKNMPIELLASTLPYDYVVSISSSALLNLKTFGFQGLIISYGAKRCSLTNKYKNIHEKIIPFFIKNKIEVID